MMENILHERLRDHKGGGHNFTVNNTWGILIAKQAAQDLADEIERYYIPRPRFEDGEPVQWREQGLCWQDTDDYNPQVPWYFTAIDRNGIPIATTGNEIVSRAEMTDDGFVKRPTSKVYDADGVEIKVGDTVYEVDDDINSESEEVESIHESTEYPASWLPQAGKPFVKYKCGGWNYANEVTHREPDSLEKLRDDIDCYMRDCALDTDTIDEFEQRFTALIERGA